MKKSERRKVFVTIRIAYKSIQNDKHWIEGVKKFCRKSIEKWANRGDRNDEIGVVTEGGATNLPLYYSVHNVNSEKETFVNSRSLAKSFWGFKK